MNLAHVGTRHHRVDLIDGGSYIAATNIYFELYVNGVLYFKPGVLTPSTITDYSLTWSTDHYDLTYTYKLPYGAQIADRVFGDVSGSLFEETQEWAVDVPYDAFYWKIVTPNPIPRREDKRTDFYVTAFAISLTTGQAIPAPVAPELSVPDLEVAERIQRTPGQWDWRVWSDPAVVSDGDTITFAVSGEDIRSVMVEAEAAVPVEDVS